MGAYDAEAHRAQVAAEADEAYARVYADRGAIEAYWVRRSVYGYAYPADQYSRLGAGAMLCYQPRTVPLSDGSLAEDLRHPGRTFTIHHIESHFGDAMLRDTSGMWHEVPDVRVVNWCSPDELDQRKQDRILGRLEAAYGLV